MLSEAPLAPCGGPRFETPCIKQFVCCKLNSRLDTVCCHLRGFKCRENTAPTLYQRGHRSLKPGTLQSWQVHSSPPNHFMKPNVPLGAAVSQLLNHVDAHYALRTSTETTRVMRLNTHRRHHVLKSHHTFAPRFFTQPSLMSDWPCYQQPGASGQQWNNPRSTLDSQHKYIYKFLCICSHTPQPYTLGLPDIRFKHESASPSGMPMPSTRNIKVKKSGVRKASSCLPPEWAAECLHTFFCRNDFDTSNTPWSVFPLMTQKWKMALKAVESETTGEFRLFEKKS